MAQPPEATHIAAEGDDWEDNDSSLGSDLGSSTTSIGSSILNHREENGRTYHAYKDGKYAFPNDDPESDRLDLQHHLFSLTFDGKLFLCPIPAEKKFGHVLDVGTGTGIWAIDFADEHPEATVVGVDLSPIQPHFIPPNVTFQVDDVEELWTFSHKFDFIYSRMMTASFTDWPKYLQQAFDALAPGGFMELADITFPIFSDDGSLTPDHALSKWSSLILEASRKAGRQCDSAKSYKRQMEDIGFTNCKEVVFKWPSNRWPKDKKIKEFGESG